MEDCKAIWMPVSQLNGTNAGSNHSQ